MRGRLEVSCLVTPFPSRGQETALVLMVVWLSSARPARAPSGSRAMTGVLHASPCGHSVLPFSVAHGLTGCAGAPWLYALERTRRRARTLRALYLGRPCRALLVLLAPRFRCACSLDLGTGSERDRRTAQGTPFPSGTGPRWVSRGGRTENAGRGTEGASGLGGFRGLREMGCRR